jgi:hypothetical protein
MAMSRLTQACFFVSFKVNSTSGLGREWPIIIGPNTLAKLDASILHSGVSATLQRNKVNR